MKIIGLQKFTLVDYPKKLACSIFLAGCNYRCGYCHNPELVLIERIKEHSPIKAREIFAFLKDKKKVLEGICIGGGEPTLNIDLPNFLQKIKKIGYDIKLDTNGSNPETLKRLIKQGLVDYVAMDIKAPKKKYSKVIGLAGCSSHYLLDRIEKSMEILKQNKVDYEFRTTVVPGLIETEDVLEIVKWISPAKRYCLQSFRPKKTLDPRFQSITPNDSEELFVIKQAIAPLFDDCCVR